MIKKTAKIPYPKTAPETVLGIMYGYVAKNGFNFLQWSYLKTYLSMWSALPFWKNPWVNFWKPDSTDCHDRDEHDIRCKSILLLPGHVVHSGLSFWDSTSKWPWRNSHSLRINFLNTSWFYISEDLGWLRLKRLLNFSRFLIVQTFHSHLLQIQCDFFAIFVVSLCK
jgi:hypothetical protein